MKQIGILITLSLTSSLAWATPKKYTSCPEAKSIVDPSGSQGAFMSKDCRTAYVLPPEMGEIKVGGYFQTVDAQTCSSYMSSINAINEAILDIEKEERELRTLADELENRNSQMRTLRRKCVPIEKSLNRLKTLNQKNKILVSKANERLLEKQQFAEDCAAGNGDELDCSMVQYDIEDLQEEVKNAEEKFDKTQMSFDITQTKLDLCELERDSEIALIKLDDQEIQDQSDKLFTERTKLIRLLDRSRDQLTKANGARISIAFLSKQMDLVRAYKEANKSLKKVNFVPLPIDKGVITFEWIKDGTSAGLPIIKKSMINGLASIEGETMTTVDQLAGEDIGSASQVFGQAAGGNMIVNLLSACLIQDKVSGLTDERAGEVFAKLVKPTVTFNYSLQVERRIQVKYEEKHLYQLIKKQSKKNGFFRSKSVNSVTESSEANKWLQVEVYSEDGDHQFVDTQKMLMDIRKEFVDAALMKVARGYLSDAQAKLIEPGPSGAGQAAGTLRKGCFHAYCQYAALALDLGNALFGGSTAESNMTKVVKAKQAEKLTDIKMVGEFGAQTFEVKSGQL